ncbi:MAG: hypothetical protein Q4B70_10825 [Lachnospiraceae bacterium]|nr:hypothetical protein [Lachnospiraceae bacterium]
MKGKQVLIVEDDPEVSMVEDVYLKSGGYSYSYGNGKNRYYG